MINITRFYNSREEIINFFRDYGKMILYAAPKSKQNKTEGKGLKILTHKQMLQRLPVALAQVKAGNTSENLLNEIREIVYCNNLTIFMNSEKSKTSKPNVLVPKLTNKLDLKMGEKVAALSNLSIYYTWKNVKSSYDNNKFKTSAPICNDKFELPDRSYSVSDIQDYFKYILKKYGEDIDKPSIQIYVKKKLKIGLHLKLKMGIALKF